MRNEFIRRDLFLFFANKYDKIIQFYNSDCHENLIYGRVTKDISKSVNKIV